MAKCVFIRMTLPAAVELIRDAKDVSPACAPRSSDISIREQVMIETIH